MDAEAQAVVVEVRWFMHGDPIDMKRSRVRYGS
jgi:hypothetical protein